MEEEKEEREGGKTEDGGRKEEEGRKEGRWWRKNGERKAERNGRMIKVRMEGGKERREQQ